MAADNFTTLPANLPVPLDDGACDHLRGMRIPDIRLKSTRGGVVDLAAVPAERTIVYAYPRTGRPGEDLPAGWDEIPGARGCTPQSCSMRDHYREIREHGAEIFGLSTQTTDYQSEAASRLNLPFALLSDEDLRLTKALRLPTFRVNNWTLIKRLTLVIRNQHVEKVFYPVFPPDKHGEQMVAWLRTARS